MDQNQAPPPSVIEALVNSRYGYHFSDIELTPFDLADLDAVRIERNRDYNQFGNRASWEVEIAQFLTEIGQNSSPLVHRVARRIAEIAQAIMEASGQPTGWICLRAGLPNTKYDQARWHMDANYYPRKEKSTQYKFVLALIGASTLFYPIPKEYVETRRIIWMHMANRQLMDELFASDKIASPQRGQGAYFIAGDFRVAAIHSEPPIHENRLFFSIVPCSENELDSLKQKVLRFYEKNASVYEERSSKN